jgi:hypothetical protein
LLSFASLSSLFCYSKLWSEWWCHFNFWGICSELEKVPHLDNFFALVLLNSLSQAAISLDLINCVIFIIILRIPYFSWFCYDIASVGTNKTLNLRFILRILCHHYRSGSLLVLRPINAIVVQGVFGFCWVLVNNIRNIRLAGLIIQRPPWYPWWLFSTSLGITNYGGDST